jgi:hypothetical protein
MNAPDPGKLRRQTYEKSFVSTGLTGLSSDNTRMTWNKPETAALSAEGGATVTGSGHLADGLEVLADLLE